MGKRLSVSQNEMEEGWKNAQAVRVGFDTLDLFVSPGLFISVSLSPSLFDTVSLSDSASPSL